MAIDGYFHGVGGLSGVIRPLGVMQAGRAGVGVLLRMVFGRARGARSPRCRHSRHRFHTERLVWCHPTGHDLLAASAAASDPQAQRWLGWPPEQLVAEQHRAALLARRPGTGTGWASDPWRLIAIDRASGRLAGAASVNQEHQIGGWLGPQFRGRGLGRELFLGIATFAHHHLGIATVQAGTEPANTASLSALISAGFVATGRPTTHRLPDGRTVPAQWLRHDVDHPTTCRYNPRASDG